ncbi:MAG TPA: TonB-dependent receptor [Xanthomonadaceae bacterium]|nr:TonB-dependent receptor [Xanthomonadaceae bacterium]
MQQRNRLALAVILGIAVTPAFAEEADHETERLDRMLVTTSPLRPAADDIVQPVSVLSGQRLDDRKSATLGETLEQESGVQSSYFGPGVGRPIIRGLEGPRVQVLASGLGSLDVSSVSVDHAVSIEPFLADRIEVLKGPATLLYGSSAIGGVVNVVDGRMPEAPIEGFNGRAEVRGNSVSDERTGVFRVDGGKGSVAFHADAFYRDTNDYRIPDRHDDGDDDDLADRLEGSAQRNRGGALGFTWFGDSAYAGMAVSTYRSRYGIPGHGHHDDDDHDFGKRLARPKDEDEDDHDEEEVVVDLRQNRFDAKAGLIEPFSGFESLDFRLAYNDYRHFEIEIEDDGDEEIETEFYNKAWEGRAELVHAPYGGWRGALGLQYGRRDFEAIGEEAFVPASVTREIGFFVIEEKDFDPIKLEFGARLDEQRIRLDDDSGRARHSLFSVSAGAIWKLAEAWHLSLGLDRAQRAPTAEELFSDGPHIATQSFEVGDANLQRESANQVEFGVHFHSDRLDARFNTYYNRFNDFIFLADTDEIEDGLPLRQWTQADARFVGFEAEADITLADHDSGLWRLRLLADSVRGSLRDGNDLPRIARPRIGAALNWRRDGWRASLGAIRYDKQDRVAEFEEATGGYTLVNANLAYRFDSNGSAWEVFLDGRNLTDREARVHTSFLKEQAPLPGRGIGFGVRAWF